MDARTSKYTLAISFRKRRNHCLKDLLFAGGYVKSTEHGWLPLAHLFCQFFRLQAELHDRTKTDYHSLHVVPNAEMTPRAPPHEGCN
jgi:hypothetical protein